jgi:hypothetical protein
MCVKNQEYHELGRDVHLVLEYAAAQGQDRDPCESLCLQNYLAASATTTTGSKFSRNEY